jgi:hypothetical protein
MSIVRDESLTDHAKAIHSTYDATAKAITAFRGERAASKGLPSTGLPVGSPWNRLPAEVRRAKEEYETALKVRLEFRKYVRSHNGDLEDAVETDEALPADPVQLSRAVTVSSSQGAVLVLEQWLAEAIPVDDHGDANEGGRDGPAS